MIDGPPAGSYWRVNKERFQELVGDNRIWWGKGDVRPGIKRFLSEVRAGVVPQTLWSWKDAGSTRNAKQELSEIMSAEANEDLFLTPKPSRLLQRILQIATDKDSIVLDSFAGSGTTAHAVLALNKEDGGNRRFILVESEDYVDRLTTERVRRVIRGVPKAKDENLREGLGGTFSYFKLGKPLRLRAILEGSALPDYELLASYVFFHRDGRRVRREEDRQENVVHRREPPSRCLSALRTGCREVEANCAYTRCRACSAECECEWETEAGIRANEISRSVFSRSAANHVPTVAVPNLQGAGDLTMQLKAYQTRTWETLRFYLDQLAEMKTKAAQARELDPEFEFDFAVKAWEKTAPGRNYFPRRNGLGEPLPSICLKIPSGGGKTLLATHTIDLVNLHYRQKQTGLVLWIVPTTQIYNQTLAAFRDRDHPYRQILDATSANRTLILEKQSGFSPADVRENLCVLMLMLPSANRRSKEQLRLFRDSGGFDEFFPRDDDQRGHAELLAKIPTLHTFEKESGFWGRQIKTSLGNTLQLLNPLIILDEGHKAYSENARKTLEEFNPCLILELSATPAKTANVLVEILGKELLAEEMIKLDLHIQNRASAAWKDTMLAAIEHRDWLEEEARTYQSNTDVYIRPICLIQVERTGKDQRKPGVIHADDVKDYLIKTRGLAEEQIAIKTSQLDELKEVDEVGGLLSRDCPIRYIITKQALQEGWDCSFAHVLTILTNPGSKNSLTQLVGRILRQPYARRRAPQRSAKVMFSVFSNVARSCSNKCAKVLAWKVSAISKARSWKTNRARQLLASIECSSRAKNSKRPRAISCCRHSSFATVPNGDWCTTKPTFFRACRGVTSM